MRTSDAPRINRHFFRAATGTRTPMSIDGLPDQAIVRVGGFRPSGGQSRASEVSAESAHEEVGTGELVSISCQTNVELSVNITPFLGVAKRPNQFLKCFRMLWSVFKPSQKIERLANIATMIE